MENTMNFWDYEALFSEIHFFVLPEKINTKAAIELLQSDIEFDTAKKTVEDVRDLQVYQDWPTDKETLFTLLHAKNHGLAEDIVKYINNHKCTCDE